LDAPSAAKLAASGGIFLLRIAEASMKRLLTAIGVGSGIALVFGLAQRNHDGARTRNAGAQGRRERGENFASRAVLNVVSREDLMGVYGIGPVLADRIIANRPYGNDADVVERGIIPEGAFENIRTELLRRRAG
jgi:DNA uptake protein ComE-like DNA-binding protein